jgi:nucleoside-diphosphate-sugar epimerase
VVIHCGGIAHQKIGAADSATYMRVNSEATENLADAAAKSNPDVRFIFLSSVSVYGENSQISQISQNKKDVSRKGAKAQRGGEYPQITQISQIKRTKTNNDDGIGEDGECWPSSDYAVSKLDAERRLIALYDKGVINSLVILRLAPVYDREWSLNLDRRVLAPMKIAYIRFGSGSQRMSALARPNLVKFIVHILQSADYADFRRLKDGIGLDSCFRGNDRKEGGNDKRRNSQIFNVCDAGSYDFNRIIRVFKKSGIQPNRPVISVPLSAVWFATRIAGVFFPSKRSWLHSGYNKLSSSLVFDNAKMMGTGFRPVHSLETIFLTKD